MYKDDYELNFIIYPNPNVQFRGLSNKFEEKQYEFIYLNI